MSATEITPSGPVSIVVGVDVGGTKIAAVALVADPSGAPTVLRTVRSPTPHDRVRLVGVIETLVAELAEGHELHAVGLGLAGFLDADGIARQAPNVPALVDADVPRALRDRFSVPVVVDNDANCAAWAARTESAAQESHLVVVAIGTGIGGGFIVDGHLVHGAHGFAGEPGHMVVEPGGTRCVCGQRGCWEAVASGSALDRAAVEVLGPGADGAALFAATAAGGATAEAAEAALGRYCDWLALGIANLVNLLDPSVVLITGGIAAQGDALIGRLRRALSRLPTVFTGRSVELRAVASGPDAAAIGAALIARSA